MFFLKRKSKKNNMDIEIKYIEDLMREILSYKTDKIEKISEHICNNMTLVVPSSRIDLTKYNIAKKPKNIDKFLEVECNIKTTDNENSMYYLEKINSYIDKLQKVDYKTLNFYNQFAKRMYDLKENKNFVENNKYAIPNIQSRQFNLPCSITLDALKNSFGFQGTKSLKEIINNMEDYDLVQRGETLNNKENISFTNISDCQLDGVLSDIVYKIVDFANKIKIDTEEFFVKLDFTPMEK